MNRPGVRQELDDLLCRKERVAVEQIYRSAGEILRAQVDLEQGEQQGLSELSVLALGSPVAVRLSGSEVSLLVNEHLQSLGVFPGLTQENGFLCVQGC